MIRQTKYLGKDYFVVDTNLQIKENGEIIDVPLHIQINISRINPKKHFIIYTKLSKLFGSTITVEKKPPVKKSWWKFW